MKTIWKFPLEIEDEQEVEMPPKAELLCVQMQGQQPRLWAVVDPDTTERERRTIAIHGTGHPMAEAAGRYLGTFQMHGGMLVFHAFERVNG